MVRGSKVVLAVWLFLALLTVGEGIICFEDTSLTTTVTEADGLACINVTRASGDSDTFGYGALASRLSPAAEGLDFETVPDGARTTDRFPQYEVVSFGSSLTVEICVTVILDDIACEMVEAIAVFFRQDTDVCGDEFEIMIQDSTYLPVTFMDNDISVMEGDGNVRIVVERNRGMQGGIFNLNSATVRLFEDPSEGGCLQSATGQTNYSRNVLFGCNHPTACGDVLTQTPISIQVDAPLAPDDNVVDGHRFCSVLVEPLDGCLFNFTDGNRLRLVVNDDEELRIAFVQEFVEVREDMGPAAITLQASEAVSQPFTFRLDSRLLPPADDAATVEDFTPGPYEAVFPAGQTRTIVNISINDDNLFEADTNDFQVIFVSATANYTVRTPDNVVLVQIRDDDMVNVEFPSGVFEVLEDSGELEFSLTSDKDSEILYRVTVISEMSPRASAATDGEDFIAGTVDVSFTPGNRTSNAFQVRLIADTYPEEDEVFRLRLEKSSGQEVSGALNDRINFPSRLPKTATILNDDPPHGVCFSQPEYRVTEDDGAVDISVRLNGTTAREDIIVCVMARSTGSGAMDASVTGDGDILNTEWNATIQAGMPGASFTISLIADTLAEADEMFGLELTVDAAPNIAIPCSPGDTTTVVIEDDDPVVITYTAASSRVEGEDQVYEVTFTTETAFMIPFELTLNLVNGTATGGEDFDADPITLSFTANDSTAVASVPILNDAIVEDTETFQFLTVAGNSVLDIDVSQAQGSLTILDNEAVHHFDSTMLTVAANESDGAAIVTVRRRRYLQRESTVIIQPVTGTAEGPGDFPIDPIDVTFATGAMTVTVNIPLTEDMISEEEESFLLRLVERTPVGGALVEDLVVEPDEATVLIRDPGDVVCVSFSQANYTVLESGGVAEIVVQADRDFSFTFEVEVQLMPDTAQLGQDYLPASLNLTFTPGSRTARGNVSIVDNMVREMSTETVLMVLSPSQSNVKDVCVASPGTATLNIVDDDNLAVFFEMAAYNVTEGNNISICVLTNITSDSPVVIMITSQEPRDFSLNPSMVTFNPLEARRCVQFSALEDDVKERVETITLSISLMEQEGVSVGEPGQTVVDIIDSTGLSVEFELPYYPVMEGGTVTVNVRLSNQYDRSFIVQIMAERPGDITFTPSFIEFTPPLTTFPLRVSAIQDNIAELMENITLSLDLSHSITQSYGVDLGDQGTTVIGVEDTTDDVTVTFDPDAYTVDEGSTVVGRVAADKVAEVNYSCSIRQINGTNDFELVGTTVTFMAGMNESTFRIRAFSDGITEMAETFTIQLQCSSASAIAVGVVVGGSGTASVTVQDTTAGVVVEFDPVRYFVTEGSSVDITLRANGNFSVPFNVTLSSNNNIDVQLQSSVATFQPSSQTVSVTLDALTDDVQELPEVVTLDFVISATISVVKGSNNQAQVNITDNTPPVLVNFQQPMYSVVEGNTISVGVVADRRSDLPFIVTVKANGVGGGADFQLLGTVLPFPPGLLTATVQFEALGDSVKELNETFTLSLEITDTGGLDVAAGVMSTTQVTIIDPTSISVSFEDASYSVVEGGDVLVTVVANESASFNYTVNIVTSPGSAEEADYNPGPYQVQFVAGQTSASVLISALAGDCAEPQESFTLDLELPTETQALNVHLGAPSQATVDIIDPSVVTVTFEETSYQTVEGEPITAQLRADTCFVGTISVTLEAIVGSADVSDFSQPPPGVMQEVLFNVTINTTDDSIPERTEDFQMVLRVVSPSGLNVTTATEDVSITVSITDNDAILVNFEQASYTVVEGSTINITLLSDAASSNVRYTATVVPTGEGEGVDYEFVGSSSATFLSGTMASSVQLRALSDAVEDCNETFSFILNITDTGGLAVSAGAVDTTQVTIIDDTEVTVSFEASAYNVTEGTDVSVCLVMDMASCVSVTVGVKPESGPDFSLDTSMVTFGPGETTKCAQFSALVDDVRETTEQVTLTACLIEEEGVAIGDPGETVVNIIDSTEPEITVSFDSSQYNTREGDTLMVGFTVIGQPRMPFSVMVTASNGTAMSPLDFTFTTASVNPQMDQVSIPILLDNIVEPVENFGLELTIPAGTDVLPGNITRATVFISDVSLITVNDTVTADPVYTVPIKVVEGELANPPGDLSLCYEIHGDADKWFNFISDKCLSLNAYYKEGVVFNRTGHVIRQLAVLSEDLNGVCRQVLMIMDDAGVCSVTVDGSEVNVSNSGGLMVNKNRNRIRVSVPNCDNHMVVMWASCEEFFGTSMMKVVVSRGFNLRPTSHGFLGQFWNVDVALQKINETFDALLKQTSFPHYIIHLRPPAPAKQRSFVGELFGTQWDNTPKPCLYVGSNQGGTGRADLPPLGTVVEGAYSDYIMLGAFEYDYQFTRFESESCRSPPTMEAK